MKIQFHLLLFISIIIFTIISELSHILNKTYRAILCIRSIIISCCACIFICAGCGLRLSYRSKKKRIKNGTIISIMKMQFKGNTVTSNSRIKGQRDDLIAACENKNGNLVQTFSRFKRDKTRTAACH